ncbi:hypothetical protein OROGR_023535 [Orobanche gracilis]
MMIWVLLLFIFASQVCDGEICQKQLVKSKLDEWVIIDAKGRTSKSTTMLSLSHRDDLSSGSFGDSPMKSEGRLIYYCVAGDEGEANDAIEEGSFQLKGHGLEELTQRLEEETGLEDVIVCSRNIVTGKLYPLRLALPPNNATMHVVVVPPTSRAASEFLPGAPTST